MWTVWGFASGAGPSGVPKCLMCSLSAVGWWLHHVVLQWPWVGLNINWSTVSAGFFCLLSPNLCGWHEKNAIQFWFFLSPPPPLLLLLLLLLPYSVRTKSQHSFTLLVCSLMHLLPYSLSITLKPVKLFAGKDGLRNGISSNGTRTSTRYTSCTVQVVIYFPIGTTTFLRLIFIFIGKLDL